MLKETVTRILDCLVLCHYFCRLCWNVWLVHEL